MATRLPANEVDTGEDGFTLHMDDIRRQQLDLLTREGEQALAKRIEAGDCAATHELITRNLRLVVWRSQRFRGLGLSWQDLIQEGYLGLMVAADKFNWRVGTKFSTYAVWWIDQSIRRALMDKGQAIRLPVHRTEELLQFRRARAQVEIELNREPTTAELAEALDISEAKVSQLLEMERTRQVASLDRPLFENDGPTLNDLLADAAVLPEDDVDYQDISRQLAECLEQVLDERSMRVLSMRFGLDGQGWHTLQDVADVLGVTRERIRQIEANALGLLRRRVSHELLTLQEDLTQLENFVTHRAGKGMEEEIIQGRKARKRRGGSEVVNRQAAAEGNYTTDMVAKLTDRTHEQALSWLRSRGVEPIKKIGRCNIYPGVEVEAAIASSRQARS